jgi:hypothetical protein
MLRIVSTVQSLLLRFDIEFRRRSKFAEFSVNRLAVFEPWNKHLNKDESVCHVKTKIDIEYKMT